MNARLLFISFFCLFGSHCGFKALATANFTNCDSFFYIPFFVQPFDPKFVSSTYMYKSWYVLFIWESRYL